MSFRNLIFISSLHRLVQTSYWSAYYVSDICLAVCCIIILVFLDIRVEKDKQNIFSALKRVINPATAVFLLIMLVSGLGHGIYFDYVAVYLQEELNASSSMIAESTILHYSAIFIILNIIIFQYWGLLYIYTDIGRYQMNSTAYNLIFI